MKNNVDVLYEDNHILVVVKKPNILVQADETGEEDLLTILKEYIKEKYNKPGNVYLGLVHRLDRPVGGIMVFAKTSKCASRLSEQIRTNKFNKIYNCVCLGNINNEGRIEDYLLKDTKKNIVRVDKNGKQAILYYKKLGFKNNLNLVEVRLETGRSHQIRVQMSHNGNPLYGDQKYNKKASAGEQIALFAKKLEFYHPITNEKLSFEIDLPDRVPFSYFK